MPVLTFVPTSCPYLLYEPSFSLSYLLHSDDVCLYLCIGDAPNTDARNMG